MAGGYVQVDETPVNYLEPGHGRAKQGYFWTAGCSLGDVFFRWETSRATTSLNQAVPPTFTGTVQSDGYPAYRAFVNGRSAVITLAGCWAHVRRKFYEASETAPQMSGWLLRQIQHLYRVEARLREHHAGPRWRQVMRASHSRPIMGRRVSHTLPGNETERFGYDLGGNLRYTTNFNGVVISKRYDVLNRLTNRAYVADYRHDN